MWIRDLFHSISTKVSDAIATRRRLSGFQCGDCSRVESCGLPPNDKCIVRAMQIAQGEWQRRRIPPTGW